MKSQYKITDKKYYKFWGAIVIIGIILILWGLYGKSDAYVNPNYCTVHSDCVINGCRCSAVNKHHYTACPPNANVCAFEVEQCAKCINNECRLTPCFE